MGKSCCVRMRMGEVGVGEWSSSLLFAPLGRGEIIQSQKRENRKEK